MEIRNKKGQFIKGFKQPSEYILKNKLKHIGKKCANPGEKSNLWKGGITPIVKQLRSCTKYIEWRSNVFERDNYTCVLCGAKSGNGKAIILNADHIEPFSKIIHSNNIKNIEDALNCIFIWDLNNGRTLCKNCHMRTDTIGRPKNV